jgi:Cys-tRNA(Pro) deacylase
MAKTGFPKTQAVRVLEERKAAFRLVEYKYEPGGGTRVASRELGVDEHRVIKTLVMENEEKRPFLMLMHGDMTVSTKGLARHLGVKSVQTCDPEAARRHTGYQVGGISPFGTRKPLKAHMEKTILDMPSVYINAGKRGLLAEMSPKDLRELLDAELVAVAPSSPLSRRREGGGRGGVGRMQKE